MLKKDVELGKVYVAKISGKLAHVKLTEACSHGGWYATNLDTGREIRIKSAAKLRRECAPTAHIAKVVNSLLQFEELRCILCGKIHTRKNTQDWVYHVSRGVLCRNHPGVMDWYNDLLSKAGD